METDFVEINKKKKEGKKWFSGTSFISEIFYVLSRRGRKLCPPPYTKWFQFKPPYYSRELPTNYCQKVTGRLSSVFWTLCFLSASLPLLPFLSPSSTVIFPSSGDSAPLRCLRDFLSRRECIISHGKTGKPFRERSMGLSPFLYLVTASACWSQPRNMVRGTLENRSISCFTPESKLSSNTSHSAWLSCVGSTQVTF